ncbi:MAG: hypothetical protein IH935_11290 [Acidobacteria bacterium]|nr:hypothetical protein [Acidobacteriota bacterium]
MRRSSPPSFSDTDRPRTSGSIVASGGLVVLRVSRGRRLPESGAGVTLEREKLYGASKVGFYVCEKKQH